MIRQLRIAPVLIIAACATPGTHSAASAESQAPQGKDYSPGALFAERHGEFQHKADRVRPDAYVAFMGMPNADVKRDPGSFDLGRLYVRADVPIPVDPDSYLLVGGRFVPSHYNVSGNAGGFGDETLYELGAQVGGGTFVNEDLLVSATFMPGVYSDLDKHLTSKDWRWDFDLLATYRAAEDVFLIGGVESSKLFADADAFPVLGLGWQIHPNWRLDLLLPHHAEISWNNDDSTSTVYTGLRLEGNEYRVNQAGGRFDVHTQELLLGLGGLQRFTEEVSGWAEFGLAVAGDYDLGASFDGTLEPTFYFRVGLGYTF